MKKGLPKRRIAWLALSFASLCVLFGLIILVAPKEEGRNNAGEGNQRAEFEQTDADNEPWVRRARVRETRVPMPRAGNNHAPHHLTPGEVFENPDCRIGASKDTALVVIPGSEGGARFSAVGRGGVLHSGELDFWPSTIDIAKRSDGSLLASFADLHRAEPKRQGQDDRWSARIYLDGELLAAHEEMQWFGMAGDGSSYYRIEPLAADTSRLLIHNLDEGRVRSFGLGNLKTFPDTGTLFYLPRYSLDYSEVQLYPTFYEDVYRGVGTQYFYPVGGAEEKPREFHVRGRAGVGRQGAHYAVFASSSLAYEAYLLPGDEGNVSVKRTERPGPSSKAGNHWERLIGDWVVRPESITLSPDGSLLMLYAREIVLIDTETGDLVLKWPIVNKQTQLERMRGVLGPEAGLEDIGWAWGGIELTEEHLYLGREIQSEKNGDVRYARDVFDLDGIRLDSAPIRRDPYPPPSQTPPCSPEALFGRLSERDGQLVFE